ncbi:hypothetical protein OZ410_11725 [Robiginitalea sp. M366]|uniref:hypothetical protein n=1 Tax=Robiginitalea aestuariiviva TaxID=3036903 RepID=UPI00240D8F0D|nr:hypothetical protein [Robiginitalea aestuariiviva]MDG1572988.1 hypothetical protein [Robiginitalea aestuariiviva]
MKRAIIDSRKLTPELARMLIDTYPQGYGDEDIITFKNPYGDWVEAVQLQTTETLYLVKISKSLNYLMAHFEEMDADPEQEVPETTPMALESEYDGSLETDVAFEF